MHPPTRKKARTRDCRRARRVPLGNVMPRRTATTAKLLPLAERQARLARMVANGEISAERAKLIDFREPTVKERAFAESLVPTARRALARRHAKAA